MSDITISRENDVQILRLTRPDKKNALTNAMYEAMTEALQSGDVDAGVAVHVFLGSEGNFCSGNDLADFMATAKGTGGPGNGVIEFLKQIPRTKKPMLAGVTGHAVGIGTTLLFHCDLVYASPTARFSTPFLDLGLVPEAASSLLFPRVMGYQRAFEMLVLGQPYSAEDAFRAGLVNAVVDDSALEETVLDKAHKLAAKPPEALRLARELMRGHIADVVQRTNDEIEAFAKRLKSPEALEAFQAFFEKRPPNFKNTTATS